MIVSLLTQVSKRAIIIIHWSLNQAQIAATSCENKAKPSLNCNGKCHLKKALIQDDDKTNSNSKTTLPPVGEDLALNKVELQLFLLSPKFSDTDFYRASCWDGIESYSSNWKSGIWHPPCPSISVAVATI